MEYGVNHGNAMGAIIMHLKGGRKIEAVKQYRTLNNVGLKEAKDACEAIAAHLPNEMQRGDTLGSILGTAQAEYAVFSRYEKCGDYERYSATSKHDALDYANANCVHRDRLFVVQIVSKSVETVIRCMKAA